MTRTATRSTRTSHHPGPSAIDNHPIDSHQIATSLMAKALSLTFAIVLSLTITATSPAAAQAPSESPKSATEATSAPPAPPARPAPDAKAARPAPDAKATRPALGAKAARDAALKAKKPLPEKTPEEKKADEAARASARARGEITFDDLKFDIEPDAPYAASMLTDSIRELDGKTIKLRGYILPSTLFRETDIEEFVLVRDNQECCFGPGAALYDCVVVNMVGGAKTDFTTRPVTVTGKFVLKEYKYPDDSGHFAIFNLQATAVK
ncbi:MAG: hypothetical protein RI963_3678 [Planctomycetota bacterium]